MTFSKNVLAFVMAGGAGTRLHPLTAERSKPSVPFNGKHRIVDFVLSCRVLGRRVEHVMMSVAAEFARTGTPARGLRVEYVPTQRNAVCLEFLADSGLEHRGDVWIWPLDREYAAPLHVRLSMEAPPDPSLTNSVTQ